MHILFITDNFPPESNAPASRTYEHAREWIKAGHRVSILTCTPNFPFGKPYEGYKNRLFQKEEMDGMDVYHVWSFMAPNAGTLKRMLDFASFALMAMLMGWRIPKPDIVIATSPQLLAGLAGYVIAKYKRIPFIFEVRDIWPELMVDLGISKEGRMIKGLKQVARILYFGSDHVVTTGEGYSERIHRLYGLPMERMTAIPNGIVPDFWQPNDQWDRIRQEMGWPREATIAIYLGTHGHCQKLSTVIEAAEKLKHRDDILIAFIGEGAEKPMLQKMAEAKGLNNIRFHPLQSKEKVPALYEAADLCIVPLGGGETFTDTYPSKLFEAMAMQCPILLSVAGKAADLIQEAGSGICVPPETPEKMAQAIESMTDDPEARSELGKKGRAFVLEHFARPALAKRFLDVMERVILARKGADK